MSWSLTDFWNWIQGAVYQISNFFSQLWEQAQNILNTGQGIFYGLASIGSAIWDSLRWFADQIYSGFSELVKIGEWVFNSLKNFGEWIWKAFSNLPNAIYSAFEWLYNGIVWAGKQIMKALEGFYNWLIQFWNNLVDNVTAWYEGWRSALNTWWSSIFLTMRNKLKQSIIANVSIPLIWKSAEAIKDKGVLKGSAMFFASLFIGPIAGYISAEVIDALIPKPSTTYFELLPPLTIPKLSPPQLVIEEAEEKLPPEKVPTPLIGYGLPYDISLTLPEIELSYVPPIAPYDIPLSLPPISMWAGRTKVMPFSLRMPSIYYEYDIIAPLYKNIQLTLRPLLTTSTGVLAPPPPYSQALPSITLQSIVVPVMENTLSLPSISIEYAVGEVVNGFLAQEVLYEPWNA